MSEIAKIAVDLITNNGRAFLETWFAIMTKRGEYFKEISLNKIDALVNSIMFMAIISIICVLIEMPAAALNGFKYKSPVSVVSGFFVLVTLWLCYATIMHVIMTVFGGKASYQEFIALFCLLTAFFPPITLLGLPVSIYMEPAIKKSPNAAEFTSYSNFMDIWSAAQSTGGLFVLIVWSIFALIVFAWFVVVLLRSSNYIHGVSGIRAWSANILFIICLYTFVLTFAYPFQNFVLRAFASSSPEIGAAHQIVQGVVEGRP